jgi:uncharacterized protein YciI
MNGLAEEGFVLIAGHLAGTEHGRLRALVIIDADSKAEIQRRLAEDPWTSTQRLQVTSIEPWTIYVGARRPRSARTASGAAA